MFPTICKIGPLAVHSYGLMLAIAVVVCSLLMSRDAKVFGIKEEIIYDLVFWVTLFGILGARIFFVLLNLELFLNDPKEIIMIQRGGLSWQGGLILGSLTAIWYMRKRKLSFLKTLDLAAPYIALGQAIGRIGCFLNGCCYGREVSWGIYFPVHHANLHPTQLYSAFGLLIIFFVLKKFRNSSGVPGQVFILYLVLASTQRFFVEFFRADHTVLWGRLSIFQFVSLGIFLAGLCVYGFTARSSKEHGKKR